MLKNDLETRRISRIGSLIVPPPRRADGANAFLTRVSFQGSASLLIKHKAAAHGNMGETSGRLTDATNWGIAFGTLAARCSPLHKRHTFAVSRRDAPESCQGSPSKTGGCRECRVRAAPAVSCAMESGCAHEHTGSAEASGIPCVMALRLMPCSPRRRIRLVTVVGGCCGRSTRSGQSEPPPTWHQQRVSEPHGFAVRSNVVRLARPESLTRFNPPCDINGAPTLLRPPHPIPRS